MPLFLRSELVSFHTKRQFNRSFKAIISKSFDNLIDQFILNILRYIHRLNVLELKEGHNGDPLGHYYMVDFTTLRFHIQSDTPKTYSMSGTNRYVHICLPMIMQIIKLSHRQAFLPFFTSDYIINSITAKKLGLRWGMKYFFRHNMKINFIGKIK